MSRERVRNRTVTISERTSFTVVFTEWPAADAARREGGGRRRQVVRAAATASHAVVRRRPAAGEPLALLLLWVAVLARNSQTMDGSVSGAEGERAE